MSDDAQHHLPVMLTEIVALLAPALQPVESGPPTSSTAPSASAATPRPC